MLLNEVQEQRETIGGLEAEIQGLKARLQRLEAGIARDAEGEGSN